MCVIIYKATGVPPPEEALLKEAFKDNPDGAGILLKRNGSIIIKKGFMNIESFLAMMSDLNVSIEEECAYHFRIRTSGKTDEGNTHPFPITTKIGLMRSTDLVSKIPAIMHNGTIAPLNGKDEKLSDTGLFASKFLTHKSIFNGLMNNDDLINRLIKDFIGASRILIMSPEHDTKKLGDWRKHVAFGGLEFSNAGLFPTTIITPYTTPVVYSSRPAKTELSNYGDGKPPVPVPYKSWNRLDGGQSECVLCHAKHGGYMYEIECKEGRYCYTCLTTRPELNSKCFFCTNVVSHYDSKSQTHLCEDCYNHTVIGIC